MFGDQTCIEMCIASTERKRELRVLILRWQIFPLVAWPRSSIETTWSTCNTCIHACMYLCMYFVFFTCMHVFCMCTHTHTHTHAHIHTHTHTHTNIKQTHTPPTHQIFSACRMAKELKPANADCLLLRLSCMYSVLYCIYTMYVCMYISYIYI
jgi:hypothetical protein